MDNRSDLLKGIREFIDRFRFTYDIYIGEDYINKNITIIESMFDEHLRYGYNEKAILNLAATTPSKMMKVSCKNNKLKLKIYSKAGKVPSAEASMIFDLSNIEI